MSNQEGIDNFIEYLNAITEMIVTFKGLTITLEVISDLVTTEEQVELANAYMRKIQQEWNKEFLKLLEFGVKWLIANKENLE